VVDATNPSGPSSSTTTGAQRIDKNEEGIIDPTHHSSCYDDTPVRLSIGVARNARSRVRVFSAGRAPGSAIALCFGPPGWSAALALVIVACSGGDATRFETDGNGMVRDASTGLEWTRRDAAHALAWEAAEDHCRSLELAGSRDWRLPEIDELSALYDEAAERPCGSGPPCQLDPAIELRGPFVWSATASQPTRRFYVDFRFGTRLAPLTRPGLIRRVLCVRGGAPSKDPE
jgi:hypothetical protein